MRVCSVGRGLTGSNWTPSSHERSDAGTTAHRHYENDDEQDDDDGADSDIHDPCLPTGVRLKQPCCSLVVSSAHGQEAAGQRRT